MLSPKTVLLGRPVSRWQCCVPYLSRRPIGTQNTACLDAATIRTIYPCSRVRREMPSAEAPGLYPTWTPLGVGCSLDPFHGYLGHKQVLCHAKLEPATCSLYLLGPCSDNTCRCPTMSMDTALACRSVVSHESPRILNTVNHPQHEIRDPL